MKPIPMVDLAAQQARLKARIDAAVAEVFDGTRYILGPNVEALEDELADYLGVAHALSCASGTDALHLALRAAGVGPGDEVITTPFTFIATAEAICYCGADPVFVDIDERSFNIDVERVAEAISPRTRALLPVHLFGQPADLNRLRALSDRYGLMIVEDCAQSFGATIDDRRTGSIGDLGAFSFFPSKNLGGCGDGGLVTTSDDALADRVGLLRNHGRRSGDYIHETVGYNSRLDELQAAILRVKLDHIEAFNAERRRVAETYREVLADTPLVLPHEDGIGRHVYHQFTVLVPDGLREALQQALRDRGIASAVYYPTPLHRQPAFSGYAGGQPLEASDRVAQRCLSLPIYPELETDEVRRIGGIVRDILSG